MPFGFGFFRPDFGRVPSAWLGGHGSRPPEWVSSVASRLSPRRRWSAICGRRRSAPRRRPRRRVNGRRSLVRRLVRRPIPRAPTTTTTTGFPRMDLLRWTHPPAPGTRSDRRRGISPRAGARTGWEEASIAPSPTTLQRLEIRNLPRSTNERRKRRGRPRWPPTAN